MSEIIKTDYEQLVANIGDILADGRNKVVAAINTTLVQTYWTIGQHIVEYEQQGNERAEYGSNLLDRLVKDLKERYGVGFSRSNVHYMRKLYVAFPGNDAKSGAF